MLTEQEFHLAAERYLDMVYRIALNYFRHPQDAEDAAQEAMLRLWRTDTNFEGEDHLRRFLVRVTLNVCRDFSRSPWRKRTVPLESCREPEFSTPERTELYRAVMDLPAKYRLPLYLYYFEGYAVAEVGQLLDLNPSTVQTRLARARAKLKQELEE
jgi:RNA polymerase sigma factor (sigma-70 family)